MGDDAATHQLADIWHDVFSNVRWGIAVASADGATIVTVNKAFAAARGYTIDELVGMPALKLFAPSALAALHEGLRTGNEPGGNHFRSVHVRKDGSTFPVEILSSFICGPDGALRYRVGHVHDISAQRDTEDLLAAIVNDSDDAIMAATLDGVITSWNKGAERMFGWTAAEMVGQSGLRLLPPEYGPDEGRVSKRILAGERVAHFETERMHRDGRRLDTSVSASAIRDAHGNIVGISAIVRDITEKNQTQRALVAAKEAAEAASRELESFSYSVAHDLRAPLRSIDGFSQALLEDYAGKLDATGERYLGFVRQSAQLMARLIDDILLLSRVSRSELQRTPVDLSALARRHAARAAAAEPTREVEWVIADGLVVEADQRLVEILLDNLLGNAWKFTSKTPHARIEVGSVDGQCFVRDNGAGFDMRYV